MILTNSYDDKFKTLEESKWLVTPAEGTVKETKNMTDKKYNTPEELIDDVNRGTYITRDNRYIVKSDWFNNLTVFANPSQDTSRGMVVLDKATLKELYNIYRLIGAEEDLTESGYIKESAFKSLTNNSKDTKEVDDEF